MTSINIKKAIYVSSECKLHGNDRSNLKKNVYLSVNKFLLCATGSAPS